MKVRKIISIYASGFLVGISLVLYPAAGSIFTDEAFHGFSQTQYGSIFLPQIILAIMASLSAPLLARRIGMKPVLLLGLMGLLLSMLCLAGSSRYLEGNLDYVLIMLGTGFLGMGFGFGITALNPLAYSLFPGKETSAVTAMHVLLGAGTASSAMLLNTFQELGYWYGAALAVAGLILLIFLFSLPLDLSLPKSGLAKKKQEGGIPVRIWLFALGMFLYGACEATFGNWGSLFLEKEAGLSVSKAALGLTLFWGAIAVGRILFTLIALRYPTKWLFMAAPLVAASVFFLLPYADTEFFLMGLMVVGGMSMSFLFPRTVSGVTDEFPAYAALISGLFVATLQLGTGINSQLIGALSERLSLTVIFQFSGIYALGMGIIIILLTFKNNSNV